MDKQQEQYRIVKVIGERAEEVIDALLADVLAGRIPTDWGNMELRHLFADRIARDMPKGHLEGSRKQAYKNAVLVNNL